MVTQIESPNENYDFARLIRANVRPVSVRVTCALESPNLGHQYLFMVIPFGKIELDDSERFFSVYAARALAVAGFTTAPDQSAPHLHIEVLDSSLTAYDLLFTRRIYGSLHVRANLYDPSGRPLRSFELNEDNDSFERFAFEPELSAVYGKVVDEAFSKLIRGVL